MTTLFKIFVCLLTLSILPSYSAPPKPIQCKAVSGTVSSYKIPPGPYNQGSVQASASVDVVIQHKDGRRTIRPYTFSGSATTNANSTYQTIIDFMIDDAITTINWLIRDHGCPRCNPKNN